MAGRPLPTLTDLDAAAVADDYARRRLGDHPVRALVAATSQVLSTPRLGPAHARGMLAPVDLLARAALFRVLGDPIPEAARHHVVALAAAHEAIGPAAPAPQRLPAVDPAVGGRELAAALDVGDADHADRCAARLLDHLPVANLASGIGVEAIGRTALNGHGVVYGRLLRRADDTIDPMLRTVVRSLAGARRPLVGLEWPGPAGDAADSVERACAGVPMVGPDPAGGSAWAEDLAGAVDRVQHLVPESLHTLTRAVRAQETVGERDLLRFVAAQMVADPSRAARWVDPLVLANATLDLAAGLGPEPRDRAVHTAVVWAVAPWAVHGPGTAAAVDVAFGTVELPAAGDAPSWPELVDRAVRSPDGRLSRYVLACLQAGAVDPAGGPLYHRAAGVLADAVATGAIERRLPHATDAVIDLTT
jgi:hypothetical protein